MTTSNEKAADGDVMFLQAKIRGLENEVRKLRETLLDRFAMAAIQGLLAGTGQLPMDAEQYAEDAYEIADAMMRHRGAAAPETR